MMNNDKQAYFPGLINVTEVPKNVMNRIMILSRSIPKREDNGF